jgi:ornithine cyclodeaminase
MNRLISCITTGQYKTMNVYQYADIAESIPSLTQLLLKFKHGYIDLFNKKYDIPPVGYLALPNGEMHIKYGKAMNAKLAVIKIASGSYNNHLLGLPSSSGCLIIIDTITGFPLALLKDNGLLTETRTAVAGALLAKELSPMAQNIGIIGAGGQAYYQALYTTKALNINSIYAWSRRSTSLNLLKQKLAKNNIKLHVLESAQQVCEISDVLITTTPSKSPLVEAHWLKENVHINAVGSDTEGKRELHANVLDQATLLLTDSKTQCLEQGECQYLALTEQYKINEFGQFFANQTYDGKGISLADFTGTAVLDIIIASMVYEKLKR